MHAGDAVQLSFVTLLYPQFAYVVCAMVVASIILLFESFCFGLVDAADIANHVACQFVVRVVAKQAGANFNTGKTVSLGCKTGHFLVTQTGADRHRFKAFGFFKQFAKAAFVTALYIDDFRQFGEHIVQWLDQF